MSSENTSRIPIEEVLSSKGRIKILKELAKSKDGYLTEICRRVGLNHSSTKAHLSVLVNAGLVEERVYGRLKVFRFRSEDLRARALRNLFELWQA